MNQTVAIECPAEILVSLHMNSERLAGFMKEQTALALFRDGRLSPGTAAAWLGIPRVAFLLRTNVPLEDRLWCRIYLPFAGE